MAFQIVRTSLEKQVEREIQRKKKIQVDETSSKALLRMSLADIKYLYDEVTRKYRQGINKFEVNCTSSEISFEKLYRNSFNYSIYRSFHIGPFVCDFFCPKFGLMVEIDGDVHYGQAKMKKDFSKFEILTVIPNLNELRFTNEQVLKEKQFILKTLNSFNVLSDYEANILFKRVMLSTIRTLV